MVNSERVVAVPIRIGNLNQLRWRLHIGCVTVNSLIPGYNVTTVIPPGKRLVDTETKPGDAAVLFIGDDLALDFINTAYGVGEGQCDHFVSDASVVDWLNQAGVFPEVHGEAAHKGLLDMALELRGSARQLVEQRQAGKWASPAVLNRILALGSHHFELQWKKGGEPAVVPRQTSRHPGAVLLPVAEALAKLLAETDFSLVRQCAGDECTLLFCDHTKSRRRRWCSMALCGNRMKVAAYRARQKD
jgi:predicted RNA-binding Zn ribbon-like protein